MSPLPRGTRTLIPAVLIAVGLAVLATSAAAQFQGRRGGRGRFGAPVAPNPKYDGAFQFCRVRFQNASNGDGGGWAVDYPRADQNLSFRFSELTVTPVSRDIGGDYNHTVYSLTDPEILHCPFIMMSEPGGAYLDEAEAASLRTYLDKGGFLWADDFWGEYAWAHWESELRKVVPSAAYPIVDLPLDHPLFHVLYDVHSVPQIPSIDFWYRTGGRTSERGGDSAEPHVRALTDARGHVLAVMTHNTDFGDAFEREGDSREYFETFAGPGYAVGVNVLIYALSH